MFFVFRSNAKESKFRNRRGWGVMRSQVFPSSFERVDSGQGASYEKPWISSEPVRERARFPLANRSLPATTRVVTAINATAT